MRNFTASQQALIHSTSKLQAKEKPKKRKTSKSKSNVSVSPVKESLSNHALHLGNHQSNSRTHYIRKVLQIKPPCGRFDS
jgi:hypothetical protein